MAAAIRRPAVSPVAGWSDPVFARVAEVIYGVAGLVFPPNRQPSAEAGMRRAMSALRISDPQLLVHAVGAAGEARDAVLAELTIGETYFFREAGQLDVLRTEVLPSLMAHTGPLRPLRIWSAGCASGEEAYTLAILLRELGWTRPARILGTDVAAHRLHAARRGRYTRWALRGVAAPRIDRWFERRGNYFQLDPSIRAAAEFAPLNLVSDEYPAAASGTVDQDVVLCRNVLIYFDMPTIERIATRLLAALAPQGWLLCGASDPPLVGIVPCEVVMTPSGMAYRRADRLPRNAGSAPGNIVRPPMHVPTPDASLASARAHPVATSSPPVRAAPQPLRPDASPLVVERPVAPRDETADESATAYARADYARAEQLTRDTIQRGPAASECWIRHVRAIANQGRLREADVACVRALDEHRMVAELHYLHATLLAAASQHAEAARAARRALYIDRCFAMAHLQLGDALGQLGDPDAAARAFENALLCLPAEDDAGAVTGADGVPARRLRTAAEQRLQALRDGTSA